MSPDPAVVSAMARGVVPAVRAIRLARHLPPIRRLLVTRGLRRLKVGNTLAAFCRVLGEPESSRKEGGRVRHRFVTRDLAAALITAAPDDPTVLVYTITVTNRRFRPRLNLTPRSGKPLIIRLSSTTVAEAADMMGGGLDAMQAELGANTWAYQERHYLGRPGDYQYVALAAGELRMTDSLVRFLQSQSTVEATAQQLAQDSLWAEARRLSVIEGYTIYETFPLVDEVGWCVTSR